MLGLSQSNRVEPINGMRVTQSIIGASVPIIIGTDRVPGMLLWYGDLTPTIHHPPGGKGFGAKGSVEYTYTASFISLLCNGPIVGINSMWDQTGEYQPVSTAEDFYVLDAPAAPVLSQVSGGNGSAQTVYVVITATNGTSESAASPESSFSLSASSYLQVESPSGIANATGYKVYIGTTSGGEKLVTADSIPMGTNYEWNTTVQLVPRPPRFPIWNPVRPGFGAPYPVAGSLGSDMGVRLENTVLRRMAFNPGSPPSSIPSGSYANDGNGNYVFPTSAAGSAATANYSYYVFTRITTELYFLALSTTVNPSHGGTVMVQNTSGATHSVDVFQSDLGVDYYPSGTPLTKVAASPAAGEYSVSVSNGIATYIFNSADAANEVVIKYAYYDNISDPWSPSNLNVTFADGTIGQPVWSFLSSKHPDQAIPYSGMALGLWQDAYLGMSAAIPASSYEVISGTALLGGNLDASLPEALQYLMTTDGFGVNYPTAAIDDGTWFNNADSAQAWIDSAGLYLSHAIQNQSTVASVGGRWLEAFQVAAYFSEGMLKLKPFGDQTLGSFTPDLTVRASFTDSDYIAAKGSDPVTVVRKPWADAYNRVQVGYSNRANSYNDDVVYEDDPASINLSGQRTEPQQSFNFIKTWQIASAVANMRLKRSVLVRNTYRFKVPITFEYLEPMDIVTISDSRLGLDSLTVRIISVQYDTKNGMSITAEEFPGNGYAMPTVNPKANSPWLHPNAGTTIPGTTTFYALAVPYANSSQVGTRFHFYATSDNPTWGGAQVYMSLDGSNYSLVANLVMPSRIGTLNSALPAVTPNPVPPLNTTLDTANTLGISLATTSAVVNTSGAALWSPDTDYPEGAFVAYDSLLWAATNGNQGSMPTMSNKNWQHISSATAGESPISSVSQTVAENLGTVGAIVSAGLSPEFLSYENVALGSGPNTYKLTNLYRGAFRTAIESHAAGDVFLRLQDATGTYDLPSNLSSGQTVYFRCVGVNSLGATNQVVDNATPIEFVIGGPNTSSELGATQDFVQDGVEYVRLSSSNAAGNVAYNYKGVWSSSTAYVTGDEVVYGATYWLATSGSTGQTPTTGSIYWQPVGSYSGFEGAWSSATAYVPGAEVTYTGSYWVCLVANTNSAPSSANSNWQLAGTTSASNILYGNGSTVDSLRPAQAGADITAQNTAADTNAVSGTAAATVAQGATGINHNLIADSDFKFGSVYWTLGTKMQVEQASGDTGGNQIEWIAGASGDQADNAHSAPIPVNAGHVYTLSGYINANLAASGDKPNWNVLFSDGSFGAGAYASPGQYGRYSFTFTVPSGVTSLQIVFGGSISPGVYIWASTPQLQFGSIVTAYQPGIMDSTTGYFKAGASQIDLSSSIHLNKTANNISYLSGGTVDSFKPAEAGADVTGSHTAADTTNVNGVASHLISPISTLMPAEAGADVTGSNTSNNTANVGSLAVSGGGLTGSSGAALDSSGNLKLKNLLKVPTAPGSALATSFTDLPGLSSTDSAMTVTMKGNPALISFSLHFFASSSGGEVTSIGFVPGTATSPPTIDITISGDGAGAGATVSWSTSNGGASFTSTLHLTAGSGYTYANAVVTISGGSGYSGDGAGTYSCTVSSPVPISGTSISVQVGMDGVVLIDPIQLDTDGNGRARVHDLELFNISAGSHTFDVQGSGSATFVGGNFSVIELG